MVKLSSMILPFLKKNNQLLIPPAFFQELVETYALKTIETSSYKERRHIKDFIRELPTNKLEEIFNYDLILNAMKKKFNQTYYQCL